MRKKREIHETIPLWRKRTSVGGVVREVRCLVDHLGEGLFELRLESGRELLASEPFQETEKLLSRAEELRNRDPGAADLMTTSGPAACGLTASRGGEE